MFFHRFALLRRVMAAVRNCRLIAPCLVLACLVSVGCRDDSAIVVYTALDSEFSEPVLQQFTQDSGIRVRPRFDTESTKTVGLTEAIISESRAGHVRCDVFWNNEILNTLRLRQRGLLDVYVSPVHKPYPAQYRAADGTWHGFAGRARVLIVNTDRVPQDQWPRSILDLTDPKWQGQAGIGKPLFGTTATHAACLFAKWGDQRAKEFFRALRANDVAIESGNKQVALRVASGQLALGMTDTDDAIIEKEKGLPVAIIFPDSAPGELGTLFIPNTLAVIKGARRGA
ncbi:MAG: extracellular solute-binding protein, partial [Planctomycetota bacterium]|nr:extracellular solute-binding protein [Planctomycetota bacterium]